MPGRSASRRRTSTRSSRAVAAIAPGFGGINLEDISAPRCFEIERRLRERLDIPVFHDDQHGTAVVVLAAFLNALQRRRQAARGRQGRHRRRRRRGRRDDARSCSQRACGGSSAATGRARSTAAGPGLSPTQGRVRRADEPGRRARHGRRGARGRGRLHRRSPARARSRPRRSAAMADGAIVFAMANPTPGGAAGGDRTTSPR